MARRFNNISLEDGAACMHCDHPFERPYDRQPDWETVSTVVLRCPECGNMTVFSDPRFRPPVPAEKRMREPGED